MKLQRPLSFTALLSAFALMGANLASAQEAPGVLDSIQYADNPDGTAELKTGITSFRKADGTVVDLVGVVHIGDGEYYRKLNNLLATYDVVLYEMVGGPVEKRDETQIRDELKMTHFVQRMAQNLLGLKYQLDGIDYNRPNFVHADANWEQWENLMESKNQSMASLFTRAMEMENSEEMQKHMEAIGGEEIMTKLGEAIMEFNPTKFKRSMAPMLANSEEFITLLEGDDGTVLISERNKIVMQAIDQQLTQGQKRIAVFYGAGHMPDFKTRLEAQGFEERDTKWMTAWNMGDETQTLNGLDVVENLLKDDYVIESLMTLLRGLSTEAQ